MEEVINDVADQRLSTGQHKVIQRLASWPCLPRLVFFVFVQQLLSEVQCSYFDRPDSFYDNDQNGSYGIVLTVAACCSMRLQL